MELILILTKWFIIMVVAIFIISGEGGVFIEFFEYMFNPEESCTVTIKKPDNAIAPPIDPLPAKKKRGPEDEIHFTEDELREFCQYSGMKGIDLSTFETVSRIMNEFAEAGMEDIDFSQFYDDFYADFAGKGQKT